MSAGSAAQAAAVAEAISSGIGQMVQALVDLQVFAPEAIISGVTQALLGETARLRQQDAASDFIVAALGSLAHDLGHCSVEVAEQALRDLLPQLRSRIESSL